MTDNKPVEIQDLLPNRERKKRLDAAMPTFYMSGNDMGFAEESELHDVAKVCADALGYRFSHRCSLLGDPREDGIVEMWRCPDGLLRWFRPVELLKKPEHGVELTRKLRGLLGSDLLVVEMDIVHTYIYREDQTHEKMISGCHSLNGNFRDNHDLVALCRAVFLVWNALKDPSNTANNEIPDTFPKE